MASGYLDLAYLIEISIVFNLAYREIKHGSVLEKMKKIREKMLKDEELQERIGAIKKDNSLAGDTVEESYMQLTAITECDEKKSEDCTKNTKSSLCRAWKHSERDCKYFVNFILTGKGLHWVNISILVALLILLFATVFPHLPPEFLKFSIIVWTILCVSLISTIIIPIYLLLMSEKIGDFLVGKNGKIGRIDELEQEFNTNYNKYLVLCFIHKHLENLQSYTQRIVQTIIENLRGRYGKTVANNSISKATKIEMLTQCNPLPVNNLLLMSEKIGDFLVGKNGQIGRIDELEQEFNTNYNKYLVEQKPKQEYTENSPNNN
jgi:hypothetical protein